MSTKKYVVIGGEVRSRTDGQIHHISALRLVRLYGVNPMDCYLFSEASWEALPVSEQQRLVEACIVLRPDYYGRYRV